MVIFRSLLILLDGIPSPGQLIMPALTLAIGLNFFSGSLKFNQNDELSLKQIL